MKPISEIIDINSENPIKISVFESKKLKYPLHYHPEEYELTLTIGSCGLRLAGDHIDEFGDIDLALIGPGLPHCWLNNFIEEKKDESVNIKVVVIHFNQNLFSDELLNRRELVHIRSLLLLSKRGIIFQGKIREEIKHKILKLKIDPDFSTWISIYSIFDKLSLSNEYTCLSSLQYNYKGKIDEINNFEKVHTYIFYNFRAKIKIGEVSSLIGMNESAFSHYFKKRTLKSFTDFVNELRLNYAAKMLTNTNINVAEIAFDSGFNNLSNFNRIFKKWRGFTPHQWRKKIQPGIL